MIHSCPQTPSSQAATKPFAMLRHDFAGDLRLSDGDVRVLLALLYWSRDQPDCWPSVETIGKRAGKKERATRMALRNLEHYGYIRCEADPGKKTGRRIVLAWKADGEVSDAKEGDSPRQRHSDRSRKSILADGDLHLSAPRLEPVSSCEASLDHQQPHVHPSEPKVTLPPILETGCVVSGEPISEDRQRAKVMAALPVLREMHGRPQGLLVNSTATLMANLFLDEHSLDFHRLICWRVAKGKLSSQVVADAFVATYDKIVEHNIGVPGSYYHGCLRNLIGGLALDEFAAEFNIDRERAKREYACQDTNPIGAVA